MYTRSTLLNVSFFSVFIHTYFTSLIACKKFQHILYNKNPLKIIKLAVFIYWLRSLVLAIKVLKWLSIEMDRN